MDKHQKALKAIQELPEPERKSAVKALARLAGRGPVSRARALDVAEDILIERARNIRKRRSDKDADSRRRVLVGARVLRADAAKYRAAAEEEGVSMYAWVIAALEAARLRAGAPGGQ